MAFSVISNWDKPVNQKRTFLCDTAADIDNLPTQATRTAEFPSGVPTGSEASVASNSAQYILSPSGVWTKKMIEIKMADAIIDVQKSDGTSVVTDGIAVLPDDLQGVTDVQKSDGTSVVVNGVATLPDDLQGISDVTVGGTSVVKNGIAELDMTVASEAGAFGLRFYNGALQYKNGSSWVTIPLGNQNL